MDAEAETAESLAQLRTVQQALDSQQRQFEARLAEALLAKDSEYKPVIDGLRAELQDFGNKFKSSQEVCDSVASYLVALVRVCGALTVCRSVCAHRPCLR